MAGLKMQVQAMKEAWEKEPLLWRLINLPARLHMHAVATRASYHDARCHFISCNKLPVGFMFNTYLKRCIRNVFVDLLHIHWAIWLALCLLVQLDLFVVTSFVVDDAQYLQMIDYR